MPAKRCACPIAMPPDTPMPCIVKQTLEGTARMPSGIMALLALVELVAEELLDGGARRFLVGPVGFQLDRGAQPRGEHHHAHDALRVHAPPVARDPHRALELGGHLRELGRGARVQAQLVGDLDGALDHGRASAFMRITPSIAPPSAFSSTASSG